MFTFINQTHFIGNSSIFIIKFAKMFVMNYWNICINKIYVIIYQTF